VELRLLTEERERYPDVTDLDERLNEPAFRDDPYPVYARLREEAPVFWSETQQQWLVSRLKDAQTVLRDAETFSSFGWERRYISLLPTEAQARIPSIVAHVANPHLLISDGALHDRLRARFRDPFLPRSVDAMRPRITAIVSDLLDATRDQDSIDVVSDFAHPLPTLVIAELFGAPEEDRVRFREWSSALTDFFGKPVPDPEEAVEVEALLADFRAFLSDLIERRRVAPRDDLATLLADETWDPEMAAARLGTAVLLIVAGHETTTNLIANTIAALLLHPEQLARVRSDPARIDDAIDETLRWDPPIQRVRRVVARDDDRMGVAMRRDDRIAVLVGAANRDPDLCEQPELFDITRRRTPHLAFGSGLHSCIGNRLARIEAAVAIAAFLDRFPDARIDDTWLPSWRPKLTQRSLVSLRVRTSVRSAAAVR
jgi:cytochrome P450